MREALLKIKSDELGALIDAIENYGKRQYEKGKSWTLYNDDGVAFCTCAGDLLKVCEAMLKDNHELGELSKPVADEARAAIARATYKPTPRTP